MAASLAVRPLPFSAALLPLHRDEILHLALSVLLQGIELLNQPDVARGDGLPRHVLEELADAHLELGEDAEEGVQADPVLTLLHAGEIGLLDTEPGGELHLGELALLAQLTDLASDQLDLPSLRGSGHDDQMYSPYVRMARSYVPRGAAVNGVVKDLKSALAQPLLEDLVSLGEI